MLFTEVAISHLQNQRKIRRLRKGQGKYPQLEEELINHISSEREKGHLIRSVCKEKQDLSFLKFTRIVRKDSMPVLAGCIDF